jgi:hypothetical protein
MKIVKSKGQTPTESHLGALADRTFLKLWCYANPYKSDGKELCDLIAVFENHIFCFFDRESKKFDPAHTNVALAWSRWKREVVDKQMQTATGAQRYLSNLSNSIYLDAKCKAPFPLKLPSDERVIHKIIVAHGASEACKAHSVENVYGSLAISYGERASDSPWPFKVEIEKKSLLHIFDSHNLEIVLSELDTITDFSNYLMEKERAIEIFDVLMYCGEEDLLAHYLMNYDKKQNKHIIGPKEKDINLVMIGEGEWKDFSESERYNQRKRANEPSYLWDELIQRTCQNALDGTLLGHLIFDDENAIHEMAKEPRFVRRGLSERLIHAIRTFPDDIAGIARKMTYMPSYEQDKGYVFLQLKNPDNMDFTTEWRPRRQQLLEIACGAAKLKFPHLTKVVGIALDAPKFSGRSAEDFILMKTGDWTKENYEHYRQQNDIFKFFETPYLRRHHDRIVEFPRKGVARPRIIGRNEKCPCGSGLKFKRCCANKGRRYSRTS